VLPPLKSLLPLVHRNTPAASRAPWRAGFTLVEIAVALGVTAVSLVGTLVLLQNGFSAYRSAMDSSISTTIIQQVVSQYQLADFQKLQALATGEDPPRETHAYDERGLPLAAGDSGEAIYRSVGEVRQGTPLEPGSDNALWVIITVSREGSPAFRRTFTTILARQDRPS